MTRIRRAREEDADALTEIMRASSAYRGEYNVIVKSYAVTPEVIRSEEVWVAEDDGRPLGFYCLLGGIRPELDLMFTVDSEQGKGVGAALFSHMAERAAALGIRCVRIVAHPPSVGFYTRMGAKLVGSVPSFGRVTWARPELELRIAASDAQP